MLFGYVLSLLDIVKQQSTLVMLITVLHNFKNNQH